MTPMTFDIVLYQGTDQEIPLQWIHNGAPFNLDQAGIELVARLNPGGYKVVTFSSATGEIVVTDAASGKFKIALTPADLSGHTWHSVEYALMVTSGVKTYRPMQGSLILSR